MTERPFRPAGWTAPAVLAPCAAAVFGASVWWATTAVPATQAAQPGSPAASTTQNHSRAMQHYLAEVAHQRRVLHHELTQALHARHHQAQVLTKRIHLLNVEIAKAKAAAAAAAAYQPPAISYGGVPAGPAPVQVAAVPAPAPPPVQANTGASGAVR